MPPYGETVSIADTVPKKVGDPWLTRWFLVHLKRPDAPDKRASAVFASGDELLGVRR
jgi:hypothetical protein